MQCIEPKEKAEIDIAYMNKNDGSNGYVNIFGAAFLYIHIAGAVLL